MTETPDTLLEALHDKLRELSLMEMCADAKAKVVELINLTAPSQDPADISIDRPTFEGLIRLAGPSVAPELLTQLCRDLSEVEKGLTTALAVQDLPAIRSQTHVLIALAGSIGAEGLLHLAKSLNALAQGTEKAPLSVLGHRVLQCTARVRGFVTLQLADRGTALGDDDEQHQAADT